MISSFLIASIGSYQLAQVPRNQTLSISPVSIEKNDKDFDGISDSNDRCPNIPAKQTLYGCPLVQPYRADFLSTPGIYFFPTSKLALEITEKRDLQPGDLLKTIIIDTNTETILSESIPIEVK